MVIYLSHTLAFLCAECGGVTDQSRTCPCGSQALLNLGKVLDRDVQEQVTEEIVYNA